MQKNFLVCHAAFISSEYEIYLYMYSILMYDMKIQQHHTDMNRYKATSCTDSYINLKHPNLLHQEIYNTKNKYYIH
jgi:hypothetical protein